MAAESVTVVHSDTDVTPYDMATLGSRSLFHMGNAVKLAAEDALQKLHALQKELQLPADCADPGHLQEEVRHAGGQRGRHGQLHPELQVARRERPDRQRDAVLDGRRHRRRGRGRHRDRPACASRAWSTSPTSARRSTRRSSRRSSPARRSCSSASRCSRRWSSTRRASCATPRSPSTRSPACSTCRASMVNEAVVAEQKTGPFGGKGVGETGTFGVSPAIANAIHDAVGVRLTALPLNAGSGLHGDAAEMRTRNPFPAERRGGVRAGRAAREPGRGAAGELRPVRRARELRPGPVRLLHRAGGRPRGIRLPVPRHPGRRRGRSDHRRRRRSSMPCSRRSSRPAPSSAASARPASS